MNDNEGRTKFYPIHLCSLTSRSVGTYQRLGFVWEEGGFEKRIII